MSVAEKLRSKDETSVGEAFIRGEQSDITELLLNRKRMNLVDTLIHLDEDLNPFESKKLTENLRDLPGVVATGLNPRRNHLLLIAYDPKKTKSAELLKELQMQGYHAQFICL